MQENDEEVDVGEADDTVSLFWILIVSCEVTFFFESVSLFPYVHRRMHFACLVPYTICLATFSIFILPHFFILFFFYFFIFTSFP